MRDLHRRRRLLRSGLILAGFGLLAGCGTLPPRMQRTNVPRVGLFHVGLDHVPPSLGPLREELQALGYEDGRTIVLDWRNLPDEEAARTTAGEFARDRIALIVAFEDQTVRAAKAATAEVPVVFLHVNDPVADGYVQSLARPGGNLTGVTGGAAAPYPDKQLELFKDVVPPLRRVLTLLHPEDPTLPRVLAQIRPAAAVLHLELIEREVSDQASLETALRALGPGEVDGIFAASQILLSRFAGPMIGLAQEKKLPLLGGNRQHVERGALFSYGPSFAAIGRGVARYVDEILRGAKPSDLPVEQRSQLDFVINLQAAQALGLTIPQAVLLQATELIQ